MPRATRRHGALAALALLLLLPGCDKPTTPTKSGTEDTQAAVGDLELTKTEVDEESGARIPFDDAALFFELNATDNDLGLQLFLDSSFQLESLAHVGVLAEPRPAPATAEDEVALARHSGRELPVRLSITPLTLDDPR